MNLLFSMLVIKHFPANFESMLIHSLDLLVKVSFITYFITSLSVFLLLMILLVFLCNCRNYRLIVLYHGILGLETLIGFQDANILWMKLIDLYYQKIGFSVLKALFLSRFVLSFFVHFKLLFLLGFSFFIGLMKVVDCLILLLLSFQEWNWLELNFGYLVVFIELVEGFLFNSHLDL